MSNNSTWRGCLLNVKVRFGTRDDIDALVEVDCSDVETWYHYSSEGRSNPASYDELSSWERVMHGGPWMDRSALIEYWKWWSLDGSFSFN